MSIDWVTFIAQIINFLTLVWLLRHFLYKPVVGAMNNRQNNINSMLEDAQKSKNEAKEEVERYKQKNNEIDEKRSEMLDAVQKEVETKKKLLTDQAREEVDNEKKKWLEAFNTDKQNALKQIGRHSVQFGNNVARKILYDLANLDLNKLIIDSFLEHFKKMSSDEKRKLIDSVDDNAMIVYISSAFDISDEQRQKIKNAVNLLNGKRIDVDFNTAPDLISGIELRTTGYKLEWNIKDYLDKLEEEFSEAVTMPQN
jgi:F-type H+-transporting ATPase subunit b